MVVRGGLLFLLVLGISWVYVDARVLEISDISQREMVVPDVYVRQIHLKELKNKLQAFDLIPRNERVCDLCEQFTAQALYYLGENKTQSEVIDMLHVACSSLHSFKQQCITLVDYYGPLFFLEISEIQPGEFCKKVNLCNKMLSTPKQHQNSCSLCHRFVAEILVKLKDPGTQLDIIEIFLKGCDAVEGYLKEVSTIQELM
uniref:Pulmonary surfactant-associated protein B n=1 Tax=Nelumbo nucifera TaxID=4432 RepID=A0A822Y1T6_NELNU|nr:TPA_asm: hypothetical protein HUJ06_027885 [Nelumbo nucifera]